MAALRFLPNQIPSAAVAIEQVPLVSCTADRFLQPPCAAQHASDSGMPITVTFVGFG